MALLASCLGGCVKSAPPAASVAPAPTVSGDAARCSAGGLSPTAPDQQGLPSKVAEARRQLYKAAAACDFERLAELAPGGERDFTLSFGAESSPGDYWKQLERSPRDPQPVLGILARTLSLPYCAQPEGGGAAAMVYQWPSAFCEKASESDWEALRGLYTEEEIRRVRATGFFFHRVGISGSGEWLFFVAGD